ncbi:MAG: hypothetical protein Q8Q35_04060 [Nanoarchaeota archaeon]|nr:hypothetical protein [Nanoarchaeota archaeon]
MRWKKRSVREEILKDIKLSKRGAVGESKESSSNDNSARDMGKSFIKFAVVAVVLALVFFFLYGYFNSAEGAQTLQAGVDSISNIKDVLKPITDIFSGAEALGSGDYFGKKTNRESTKKGIDLDNLKIGGSTSIPAGVDFMLEYEIEYNNVEDIGSIDAAFNCYLNYTGNDKTIESNYQIPGEVLPAYEISLSKNIPVYCRINGEDTEDINEAVTVYGGFDFDFSTEDVTLPVYFIPGDVADSLEERDVNFFDAYDLDVGNSDLQATYNGEPVGVGIGVSGEGVEDQPLVVRGDALTYNTLGITITNEWNGEIEELNNIYLSLPDGVTLDEELNKLPSLGCPFEYEGTTSRRNEYSVPDDMLENLFTYYFGSEDFGQKGYHTFQCWINVEEDLIGNKPYEEDEFVVDVSYKYKVKPARTVLNIIGQDEPLVQDTIIE